MVRITEDDVYSTLRYDTWMTGREIRGALRTAKGVEDPMEELRRGRPFRYMLSSLGDINPVHIYIHLSHLVEQGYAAQRDRVLSHEELIERAEIGNDAPLREYRRSGGRRRHAQRREYEERDFLGDVVPGLV